MNLWIDDFLMLESGLLDESTIHYHLGMLCRFVQSERYLYILFTSERSQTSHTGVADQQILVNLSMMHRWDTLNPARAGNDMAPATNLRTGR